MFFLIIAYKDLQSREDTRNGAWQQEGWDEVVYYTGERNFPFCNKNIPSLLYLINFKKDFKLRGLTN